MKFQIPPLVDPANLSAALKNIADSALKEFSADISFVFAINPITHWIIEPMEKAVAAQHQQLAEQTYPSLLQLAENTLAEDILLLHCSSQQAEKLSDSKQWPGLSTLLAFAIRTMNHRKPVAVLMLGFCQPYTLEGAVRESLQEFSQQLALSLKTTWLLRRYREVVRIGQKISQELETPEILFDKLKTEVADILDTSRFFMLALNQTQTNTLDLYMAEEGQYKTEAGSALDGGCAWVIQNNRSLLMRAASREAQAYEIEFEQISGTDTQIPESIVHVPLTLRDLTLGILSVQHPAPAMYDEEDLQILELIGNQVALALGNLRLFEYLRSVNQTAQELTSKLSTEEILQDIVDRICVTAKADLVVLYPLQENTERGPKFALQSYRSGVQIAQHIPNRSQVKPDDMAWLVLAKGKPVFEKNTLELYSNLGGNPANRKGDFEYREKVLSTAALPMNVDGETVGVLFVNYRQPQRFDAPQKYLIQSLANFAAIAIRNARRLDKAVQRRIEELRQLGKIEQEISKSLNLEQVLRRILEEASKVIHADDSAIALFDPAKEALVVEAALGKSATTRRHQVIPMTREKGLALWAYRHKCPARTGNVHHDLEWKNFYHEFSPQTVSEIDVPLIYNDAVIGILNFESTQKNAFSQDDEAFILALASRAGTAVNNALTYEREKRIAEELSAMQEVEREIVSKLNLEEVLDTILEKALEVTESAAGLILLMNENQTELKISREKGVKEEMKTASVSKGQGIVWQAIDSQKPIRVSLDDPLWKEKFLSFIPDVHWELAVPISDGEHIRGVINIESTEDHPLTARDESLLQRLAALTTIALQNAERFQQAESRKKRLEALREVDQRIISQQDTPENTIKAILESARGLTDAEIAGLYLYENGEPGRAYVSRQDNGDELLVSDKPAIPDGIVNYVAENQASYLTKGDAQQDPLYRGNPDIHSEVAVPLCSGSKLIGVLNLESPRLGAFNDDDRETLEMLAGQMVIALQNAQNYSEAREQSTRFRLLAEAGEELSQVTTAEQIEDAYTIILRKVMEHNEGEVILRRYNPVEEELVLTRVERQRTVPLPQFKLTEGINGQAARERRTIIVHDSQHLPEGIATPITDPSIKTLVATPILINDNYYYGNLVLSHERPYYFKEADIKLLEGLAKQLAITLNRVDSLEAWKEAEQQARHSEIFSEIGVSTYEVTHRLGNDLGLVTRYVNKIRQVLNEEKISSSTIDKGLNDITRDVSKVLNMSRGLKKRVANLSQGKDAQPKESLPVEAMLENIRYALPPIPDNINVTWDTSRAVGNLEVVPSQITDIMTTLVSNSIEAIATMPKGKIRINVFSSSSRLYIEVSDNGPGIPRKYHKKIFNVFFSTKDSSGFGLWSARSYARANCGDLILKESEPRKGTTFALQLPLSSFKPERLNE